MISNKFKLAAIAGALAISAGYSQAAPVVTVTGPNGGDATAAELAFIASLNYGIEGAEDFENMAVDNDASDQEMSISSAVGTFSVLAGDLNGTGSCDNGGYSCTGGLAILDDDASPFSGRYPMPAGTPDKPNHNWLDSMDAEAMTLNLVSGYNAIGFYMTDPNDVNGTMTIKTTSDAVYTYNDIFAGSQGNGGAYYISIKDFVNEEIASIYFDVNGDNDGFGVDNFTIGRVPEPGTLALLGLGIAGLTAARRKQKA